MKIFGQTDTGKVRDNNQDSFRIVNINENLKLGVVCDGMGGAAGGSTASTTACDEFIRIVREFLREHSNENEYEAALRTGIEGANDKVYTMSQNTKDLEGMGTTLCAVLTDGKKVWAVSVGDSRIYMFSNNKAMQISHDHSYVQILIDSGAITKEESLTHPNKNIITQAVGTQSSVEYDTYVMDFDMDGLLLCSDGLSNYISENELNEIFRLSCQNEETLAGHLISRANDAGGADYITALVIIPEKA